MSYPDVPNALSDNPLITNTESSSQNNINYNTPQTISQNNQPIITNQSNNSNNLLYQIGPIIQPPVAIIQPIIPINNQIIPAQQEQEIYIKPKEFKTKPVVCTCPNCKEIVTTSVYRDLNTVNFICCCWCCLCWLVFQLVRDKDLNCDDAVHRCPKCYHEIRKYRVC